MAPDTEPPASPKASSESPPLPASLKQTKPPAGEPAKTSQPSRDAVVHVRRKASPARGDEPAVEELRCPVTLLRADEASYHATHPGVLDKTRCAHCKQLVPSSEFVWHGTNEPVVKPESPPPSPKPAA